MPTKYTYKTLAPVVAESHSWAEVCRRLGVKPFTGAQTYLTNKAKRLGVDSSHFLGQGHGRGKKAHNRISALEMCEKGASSHKLRLRLIEDGIKQKQCEGCGLTEWQGGDPPLELHHRNGDHEDCSLDNLQVLCANCHAQTTSHGRVAKRQTR